jgi:hypothetical protein
LPPRFGFQTSEGTLSLAPQEAQPPPDRRRGRSPLAAAALVGVSYLASFTNTPANETISLINGSGAGE